jgi:hypothetical protein
MWLWRHGSRATKVEGGDLLSGRGEHSFGSGWSISLMITRRGDRGQGQGLSTTLMGSVCVKHRASVPSEPGKDDGVGGSRLTVGIDLGAGADLFSGQRRHSAWHHVTLDWRLWPATVKCCRQAPGTRGRGSLPELAQSDGSQVNV